ncbi:MAG: sugar kinase [Synechococcales cyanobacterium M58_A2018_015]|nr:sugar kinase [Synechococcales cyanobacterium M58_A2018_015]
MTEVRSRRGLFVGLVTLDLIYLSDSLPEPNQKQVALDYTLAAGGPATNAAVTFSYLNSLYPSARLIGVIGQHPLGQLVWADLQRWQVMVTDLQPTYSEPLPTSSIVVTRSTGERAVISLNATRSPASPEQIPADVLQGVSVVLIDGHQMAVGAAIARQARAQQIPVVVDGGSWKPNFEHVLHHTDYALCSADFYPPGCQTPSDVIAYLRGLGIAHIAITRGEQPIDWISPEGRGSLPVPSIQPVDTLGAGDIFHGAFCHFLPSCPFPEALAQAAAVAARSCQSFGTRRWMQL